MNILSWNVAGLRAMTRKEALKFLEVSDYDMVCFQETKTLEKQIKIPEALSTIYPYRYWGENHGITQRKGLSGTSIWSKVKPIKQIETMELDKEGRITALEFKDFNLVTVYTPNSQKLDSERYKFRTEEWDKQFLEYITKLNSFKNTIVCGDLNVAHLDIDIYDPIKHKNKSPGFFDLERSNFQNILDQNFIDIFRTLNPDLINQFTYWDQVRPHMRFNNKGWRIDYFIICNNLKDQIEECLIKPEIKGSDHCPITLKISIS